jgi:hypothetical protein
MSPRIDPYGLNDLHPAGAAFVNKSSNQLFLIFTGVQQGLMVDPRVFMRETSITRRNYALFTDRRGLHYLQGISPRLNTFDKFLEWQREFCRTMTHVQRVFCLGTSMGAYAAVLFGYLLAAEEVWAFGPVTSLPRSVIAETRPPLERQNLAYLLRKGNGRTRYNLHYHYGHPMDEEAAYNIKQAEGVILRPHHGEGHTVVRTLLETGQLGSLLPALS